jgi:hypothetical protein
MGPLLALIEGGRLFGARVNQWLLTLRKQNAVVVLATQSPSQLAELPNRHTVVDPCPTWIHLPNLTRLPCAGRSIAIWVSTTARSGSSPVPRLGRDQSAVHSESWPPVPATSGVRLSYSGNILDNSYHMRHHADVTAALHPRRERPPPRVQFQSPKGCNFNRR